ncbi:DUF6292 family protein [Nonomuraea sp. MCN248]|uniref:DUF6292 family protein n=1 Tax=Nonomuraea corallina TaxID=2989783 RepID=A0ABT4S8F8_9ACTN|nr:DUF6292 family protein [Nonomuraea corallina]MDA0633522.1 DUF6292 family protein [Nonomuraea corallina]
MPVHHLAIGHHPGRSPEKEAVTSDGFCYLTTGRTQRRAVTAHRLVAQGALVMSSRGPWPVPWHRLQLGYLHDVYLALIRREVQLSAHWISEFVPRSATILLAETASNGATEFALAWDEESGWRLGVFVQGDERCPTLLRRQEYICGAVLPDPAEVADTVVTLLRRHLRRRWPWQASQTFWGGYPPSYRCYRDVDDGFDDLLRGHLPPDDPSCLPSWSGH